MRVSGGVCLFFWSASVLLGNICPGQRFDVTIKEPIALKEAVLNITEACHLSLSLEGEQTLERFERARLGYVTLRSASATEALEFMLQRANFHHSLEGNLLLLRYLDTRTFKIDYINFNRIGSSSSDIKIGGSSIASGAGQDATSSTSGAHITTEENFDFWGTLQDEIAQVLFRPEDGLTSGQQDTIVVNPRSGLVTVSGTYRQLKRVERYIEQTLESLKRQVLIDVQIIAVDLDGSHATGIDWAKFPLFSATGSGQYNYQSTSTSGSAAAVTGSTTTSDATFTMSTGNFDFNLRSFLNFLRTHGEARALSNPKVLAMNNQPTLISVGENINYLVLSSTVLDGGGGTQSSDPHDLFVGVLLDITPQIDQNGFITLRINPSISELKYAEDAQRQTEARRIAPDTITRRISSVVRVRDQEVVVLGGLISSYSQYEESRLPVLGAIPFLGNLFGAKRSVNRSREIVFVLTPHIIDASNPARADQFGFTSDAAEAVRLPSLKSLHE